MKNIKNYLPRYLIFGLLISLTVNIVQAQYVTLEGRQFKTSNGQNFYPICMNYCVDIVHNDGSTDYYISPNPHYGLTKYFECHNDSDCLNLIEYDFAKIVEMGFNTVHLVGPTPFTDTSGIYIGSYRYIPNISTWAPFTKNYITYPVISDSFIQDLFGFIDVLVLKAHDAGLKVILDCQQMDVFTFPNATEKVTEYMSALSNHIYNSNDTIRETVMAYVLVGEPAWNDLVQRDKQDVCDITREWYDTLKTNDPDHLVAAGGMHYFELFKWDPSVIKMDFYFPHVYPYFYSYEDIASVHDQYAALSRVNGILYWLNKNCPVPWMLGETSLSADSVYIPGSGMHGNLTDQANYIDSTLKNVRNYGGSGYSVWQYQEVWWDNDGQEDNYGLLYHGDQYSLPVSNHSLEKPAVQKFRDFDENAPLNPCGQPFNYYDPLSWESKSPGYPKTLTGAITETNTTNPIEDAYIVAWTWYEKPFNDTIYSSFNFTFSQYYGNYSLNPKYPNSYNVGYRFVGVTASGANSTWRNADSLYYPWQYNFFLQYSPFKYDLEINNETVIASDSRNFQGGNTLTVSTLSGSVVTVDSNAVSEFKARTGVTVNGTFTAALGSDVYIYCTATFPECKDYEGFKSMRTSNTVTDETQENNTDFDKQMEVKFIPIKDYAFLDVFPNPGNGFFTLNLRTNKEDNTVMQVIIFDITGSCIFKGAVTNSLTILDLSFLSKGIYYLHATTKDDSFNQKLIIQ